MRRPFPFLSLPFRLTLLPSMYWKPAPAPWMLPPTSIPLRAFRPLPPAQESLSPGRPVLPESVRIEADPGAQQLRRLSPRLRLAALILALLAVPQLSLRSFPRPSAQISLRSFPRSSAQDCLLHQVLTPGTRAPRPGEIC